MSQRDFLQAFDTAAFAAFADAGLADAASYVAPGADGSAAVACQVLVDRDVRDFADDLAPVSTGYTRITFQLAEVQPERGGVVTVDGEGFTLERRISQDESASRWVVIRA